jgi:hypothetical protein
MEITESRSNQKDSAIDGLDRTTTNGMAKGKGCEEGKNGKARIKETKRRL